MKIAVITGAGVSAESGISTFRDAGGLWEGHDVMEVASPEGWAKDRALVLDFYNQRRAQLFKVQPNDAHKALAKLEEKHEVVVITQNVDDLHERGGSTRVVHLHGELRKVRSTLDESLIYDWDKDVKLGDKCEKGAQLRPHIVWFGEQVPMITVASEEVSTADIVIIVGTSMQVYPAAGLVHYARANAQIYYIDPRPTINHELDLRQNLVVIAENASRGVPDLVEELLDF